MSRHDPLAFLDTSAEAPKDGAVTIVADAPVVVPEKVEAPVPEVKVTPEYLDLRDQLREKDDRLKKLEQEEEPFVPPSPVEDPAGYEAYRENQLQMTVLNERLNFSERFATEKHGVEFVDKVRTWAMKEYAKDPSFQAKVFADADPYGAAITAYNRDQVVQKVKPEELSEYEAWKAEKAAKTAAEAAAKEAAKLTGGGSPTVQQPPASGSPAATPKAPAAKKPLPTSIVDEPSAGGGPQALPVGPGQAFDSIFKGP